jgi:hypothetical protein
VTTLNEVEQAFSQLSPEDLAAFRACFAEFDAELWDRHFEAGVKAGRLDALADKTSKLLYERLCTTCVVKV